MLVLVKVVVVLCYRHKVIRVFPKTAQQIDIVRTLEDDLHFGVSRDFVSLMCKLYALTYLWHCGRHLIEKSSDF